MYLLCSSRQAAAAAAEEFYVTLASGVSQWGNVGEAKRSQAAK
jgi:hypothetical protein